MPGVFGGLVAITLVASPLWQLTGVVITVILAVIMGVVVGFVVSRIGRKQMPYDDKDDFIPEDNQEQTKSYKKNLTYKNLFKLRFFCWVNFIPTKSPEGQVQLQA